MAAGGVSKAMGAAEAGGAFGRLGLRTRGSGRFGWGSDSECNGKVWLSAVNTSDLLFLRIEDPLSVIPIEVILQHHNCLYSLS